jgi:hypothetical protein
VNRIAAIGFFDVHLVQVLTGEVPFRGLRGAEVMFSILGGGRPEKPVNASAIGFSDPVWDLAQRCWDGDMNIRPKVAEVVKRLGEAAASWDRLMPPCVTTENVAPDSGDPMSESMEHCESDILIPPRYFPSSENAGRIFQSSSSIAPGSPAGMMEYCEFESLAPL